MSTATTKVFATGDISKTETVQPLCDTPSGGDNSNSVGGSSSGDNSGGGGGGSSSGSGDNSGGGSSGGGSIGSSTFGQPPGWTVQTQQQPSFENQYGEHIPGAKMIILPTAPTPNTCKDAQKEKRG